MWTLTLTDVKPVPINGPQGQATGKLSWSPMIGTSHTIPLAGAYLGREPVTKEGRNAQKESRFIVLAPLVQGLLSQVQEEHVEVETYDEGINIIPLTVVTANGKRETAKTWINGNLITHARVAEKGSFVAFGNPYDKWIVGEQKISIQWEIRRQKANNAACVKDLEAQQKRIAEELAKIQKDSAHMEALEASLRSSASGSASASGKRRRVGNDE